MNPIKEAKLIVQYLRDFCGWTPIDDLLSNFADMLEHADKLNMDNRFFTLMIDTYEKSLDTIVRDKYLTIWLSK